ncbi:hypothetical protein [Agromyces sp. H66]|uniref:hypothetical protein n=1 Tax=Agromyces sp. H66 TaxID=2529859 RepID=UPI0010AA7C8B|nr:hypothetical protein [Agromyces sp. H66]
MIQSMRGRLAAGAAVVAAFAIATVGLNGPAGAIPEPPPVPPLPSPVPSEVTSAEPTGADSGHRDTRLEPIERVGRQFVRGDSLTGAGVPAPEWVPTLSW